MLIVKYFSFSKFYIWVNYKYFHLQAVKIQNISNICLICFILNLNKLNFDFKNLKSKNIRS